MKNNIEMYHFINTFLKTHIIWRLGALYVGYTSLPKGHHKDQGFNITIIMLVNIMRCISNMCFYFNEGHLK